MQGDDRRGARGRDPGAGESERDGEEALAALVESLLERARAGEALDVDRVAREHPRLADALREILPGLLALEEVARTDAGHAAVEPALPERLGPYRILRVLGRGGMGIVYLAEDDELHRRVALKLLPPHLSADPEFLARFRRESLVAARLEHPGIVRVYGVGTDHAHSFYAMQYVDGCSLDQLIARVSGSRRPGVGSGSGHVRELVASVMEEGDGEDRTGPARQPVWSPVEAARLAREVASALAFAHAQGVVHRDVKPGNVLVDREGRALVADFGLCRMDEGSEASAASGVVGTLRYMAPEQLDGMATPQSDVYGVGLLLYELLTLRPAFPESNRAALAREVQAGRVLRIRRRAPDVARDLETIVLKATARLPEERYASAAELAADLGAFLEMRPILARPPTTRYLLRLAVRRNPLAAGLIAFAFLVIALGAWRYVADIRVERNLRRRGAYVAEVAAANAALRVGVVAEARRRLDAAPVEEREWEWRHLIASADQSLFALSPTGLSVWDVAIAEGTGHAAAVSAREVVLIDTGEGRVLARAPLESGHRIEFRAGPDPAFVVLEDRAVVELDPETLALRSRRPAPYWGECALVRDELWMSGSDSGALAIDLGTGSRRSIGPRLPLIRALGTLADGGGWLVSIDGTLWIEGGEETVALPVGRTRVHRADIDAAGRLVAVALESGAVLVYDLHARRVAHSLRGHEGSVLDVRFLSSERLVTSGLDNLLRVWDLERGQEVARLSGHSRHPVALACDLERGRIISADDGGSVRVWLPGVGGGGGLLGSHDWDVSNAAFSPDGRLAATCSRDGTVRLWDLVRMEPLRVWVDPRRSVQTVLFAPDSRELTAIDFGGELWRWTLHDGRLVENAELTTESVFDSALTPDGARLALLTADAVLVFDAVELELELEIDGRASPPRRIVAGDNDRVFVAYSDRSAECLSLRDGSTVWRTELGELLTGEETYFIGLALDAGSERLAVAGGGATAAVLDTSDGTLLAEYETDLQDGIGESLRAVAFGAGGKRLFAATSNGTLLVWDAEGGECLAHLSRHRSAINALASDGERLLTVASGSAGDVRLWDTLDARDRWAGFRASTPFGTDAARAEHRSRETLAGRIAWCVQELGAPGGAREAAARLGIAIFITTGLTGESAVAGGLACLERGERERGRAVLERAAVLLPSDHSWQTIVARTLEGL